MRSGLRSLSFRCPQGYNWQFSFLLLWASWTLPFSLQQVWMFSGCWELHFCVRACPVGALSFIQLLEDGGSVTQLETGFDGLVQICGFSLLVKNGLQGCSPPPCPPHLYHVPIFYWGGGHWDLKGLPECPHFSSSSSDCTLKIDFVRGIILERGKWPPGS